MRNYLDVVELVFTALWTGEPPVYYVIRWIAKTKKGPDSAHRMQFSQCNSTAQ